MKRERFHSQGKNKSSKFKWNKCKRLTVSLTVKISSSVCNSAEVQLLQIVIFIYIQLQQGFVSTKSFFSEHFGRGFSQIALQRNFTRQHFAFLSFLLKMHPFDKRNLNQVILLAHYQEWEFYTFIINTLPFKTRINISSALVFKC